VPTRTDADDALIRGYRARLSAWFARRGRRLAFRERSEPWGVLVSEVMAQQTQIARVEPAWAAFMARFPTPGDLAAASPADVLRAWAGMGYNRRALNLQRAAGVIVERHAGALPMAVEELEALPGVGPYTARAVAAIAFGMPVAAVDTNVRRVVGRVLAGHGAPGDPGEPMPSKTLQAVSDALVDPSDPAAWTHATMDLGATLCRPTNPRCDACPLEGICRRRALAGDGILTGTPMPMPSERAARRAARCAAPAFPSTRRWLRGRIVEHLRELPDGAWTTIEAPIGAHDAAAVAVALDGLEGEGMIERRPDGAVRLPSGGR
jgi:A/G-specific adenine glycosylase